MHIEEKVKMATCRVDSNQTQIGSAFCVGESKLITAAHVVEKSKNDEVRITTNSGETYQATVVNADSHTVEDPGTDLAVLETESSVGLEQETLPIKPEIPRIGDELFWSGYATVFGEDKIDRQRFGWGRVASEKYGESGAFFEVDGLFNPSHSGGPVVSKKDEKVVGIVSASAGDFNKLEEAISIRTEPLSEAIDVFHTTKEGPPEINQVRLSSSDPEVFAGLQHTYDKMGASYEIEKGINGEKVIVFHENEIPMRAGELLIEVSNLLLETAKNTFQMGVGIVSGGEHLNRICN